MEGKSRLMGVSIVYNVSTLISVCIFIDDKTFSDLEMPVINNAPKECVLIQGDGSHEFQIIHVCLTERNNVMVMLRKKNEFSADSIIQGLNSVSEFGKGQQENAQVLPETS